MVGAIRGFRAWVASNTRRPSGAWPPTWWGSGLVGEVTAANWGSVPRYGSRAKVIPFQKAS